MSISFVLGIDSPRGLFVYEGEALGLLEGTLANNAGRSSVTWAVELHVSRLYGKDLDLQKEKMIEF